MLAQLTDSTANALIVLIVVQGLIMVGLLLAVLVLLSTVKRLSSKLEEQASQMQSLIANQVQPVVASARAAVAKLDAVADGALSALHATEPLIQSLAQISGAVQKRTTPIWMDALRLASGVFFAIRSRKVQQKAERDAQVNGAASQEALEGRASGTKDRETSQGE